MVHQLYLAIAALLSALTPQASSKKASTSTPLFGYKIINSFPHDPKSFTQGLAFQDNLLYESSGGYGKSSLQIAYLATGEIEKKASIEKRYFAEGLVYWHNKIIVLTWKERTAFVYDKKTLVHMKSFRYPPPLKEGWGITHDNKQFIVSDGSSKLHRLDPKTFSHQGYIVVTDQGNPVGNLNELEYIEGEIYANIWQSNYIARISPTTGQVLGWIDLSGLGLGGLLNGIAYDPVYRRLFVTGKLWPKIFEIELVRPSLSTLSKMRQAQCSHQSRSYSYASGPPTRYALAKTFY